MLVVPRIRDGLGALVVTVSDPIWGAIRATRETRLRGGRVRRLSRDGEGAGHLVAPGDFRATLRAI